MFPFFELILDTVKDFNKGFSVVTLRSTVLLREVLDEYFLIHTIIVGNNQTFVKQKKKKKIVYLTRKNSVLLLSHTI